MVKKTTATIISVPAEKVAPASKASVTKKEGTEVKKVKKVAKKSEAPAEDDDDDHDGYGTSRFNVPGVSWNNVSLLNNVTLDSKKRLDGFVSLQVTDGAAYNQKYKGVIYQDKEAEKLAKEVMAAAAASKNSKKRKTPAEAKEEEQPKKKQQSQQQEQQKQQGKKIVEAAPAVKADVKSAKATKAAPAPVVAKGSKKTVVAPIVEEEEEEEEAEEEEDFVFDDEDEDMMDMMFGDGEGDFDPIEGDEDVDLFAAEGDEEFDGEGDEDMLFGEGDEDEEAFFNDEDDEEMEFEEIADAPAPFDLDAGKKPKLTLEKLVRKPLVTDEVVKKIDKKAIDQAIEDEVAKLLMKEFAEASFDNTQTQENDDDVINYDSSYASSALASFFHSHPDYVDWAPFDLHPLLMKGIYTKRFKKPTPIQAEVLLPAIRDRKDIVGAAQTGSGKTLSFGLPILQAIMDDRTKRGEDDLYQLKREKKPNVYFKDVMTALIITPTRELAIQIVDHLNDIAQFAYVKAIAVVGGLSQEKQIRQLSRSPSIVVATPGRVWDMISEGVPPFTDLSTLRFFVLDEADRMVANGHFPQLNDIIAFVQSFRAEAKADLAKEKVDMDQADADFDARGSNNRLQMARLGAPQPMATDLKKFQKQQYKGAKFRDADEEDDDEEEEEDEDDDDEEVIAANDIVIEDHSGMFTEADFADAEGFKMSIDDDGEEEEEEEDADMIDEDEEQEQEQDEDDEQEQDEDQEDEDEEEEEEDEEQQVVKKATFKRMQVFLFSATLTIKDEARGNRKTFIRNQKGRKPEEHDILKPGKAMLVELAQRLPFDKPYIADFSSQYILARGLTQVVMECQDEDRDGYLYSQLYAHDGRCLVFTNSIQVVSRLTNILRSLQFDAYPLHAHMQQNQRLQVLDKFKSPKHPKSIIVCTDVAARGLDIANVELVIQYHVPRDPETYVHRAGRTARAGTEGKCIMLITPQEHVDYKRLQHVLGPAGLDMRSQHPNSRYLQELKKRFKLASTIQKLNEEIHKQSDTAKWMSKNAEAAGLESEFADMEDLGTRKGNNKNTSKHNKHVKKMNASAQRDYDDEDYASHRNVYKQKLNEINTKTNQLNFWLNEKIWCKGTYF